MAWLDLAGIVLLIALGLCIGVAGLLRQISGEKQRACRIHRWVLTCQRCGKISGREPPGDWTMGEGS